MNQILTIKTLFFITISINICVAQDLGLCANAQCSAPIARGQASQNYHPADSVGIPLRSGQNVAIYVRYQNGSLGIKVDGKNGIISSRFIRETATSIHKNLLIPAAVTFIGNSGVRPDPGKTITMPTATEKAVPSDAQIASSQSPPHSSITPKTPGGALPATSGASLPRTSSSHYVGQPTTTAPNIAVQQTVATSTINPIIAPNPQLAGISEKMLADIVKAVDMSLSPKPSAVLKEEIKAPQNKEMIQSVKLSSSSPSQVLGDSSAYNDVSKNQPLQSSWSVPVSVTDNSPTGKNVKSEDILFSTESSVTEHHLKDEVESSQTTSAEVTDENVDLQEKEYSETMKLLEKRFSKNEEYTIDLDKSHSDNTKLHSSSSPVSKYNPSNLNTGVTQNTPLPVKSSVVDVSEKSVDLHSSHIDIAVEKFEKETSSYFAVDSNTKIVEDNVDSKQNILKNDNTLDKNEEQMEIKEHEVEVNENDNSQPTKEDIENNDILSDNSMKEKDELLKDSFFVDDNNDIPQVNEMTDMPVSESEDLLMNKNNVPSSDDAEDFSSYETTVDPFELPDKLPFDGEIHSPSLENEPETETHPSVQRHILQQEDEGNLPSDNYEALLEPTEPQPLTSRDSDDIDDEFMESSDSVSSYNVYELFGNTLAGLRSFLDSLLYWMPESYRSYLKISGISARAVVFTGIIAFPMAMLFIGISYLHKTSKEDKYIGQLRKVEHDLYVTKAERDILREESEKLGTQLDEIDSGLEGERHLTSTLKKKIDELERSNKNVNTIQLENIDTIRDLEEKLDEYSRESKILKMDIQEAQQESSSLREQNVEDRETISDMTEEIEKLKSDVDKIREEKESSDSLYSEREKQYEEQVSHLKDTCSQLLDEAVAWNTRVKDLSDQVYSLTAEKTQLEKVLETKTSENETLKTAFTNLEVFQSLKDGGLEDKSVEEKLNAFINISLVRSSLEKSENANKSLTVRLQQEKKNVMDLEVQIMESKSDFEKMKTDLEQAVRGKADAETKLNFLTEHFEAKEQQLQKKLGILEVVKQQKEENSTHAERQIQFIEKENESYKYQLSTMKQEMEETERNLKNQIAAQEKKAHENWLAARAAERKTEEMKQECTQLRQRLTLLEREQESWMNSSQSDIVRPVAQRIADGHGSQEGSVSSDYMPGPLPPMIPNNLLRHPLHPPLGPMMGPPPPPPPFLPPFDPMMGLPLHRPQPWHMMPDKNYDSDRRNTPSDFEAPMSRRRQTPPFLDGNRRSSSPIDGNSHSRGSSPHEMLPDFHNVPPHLPRHPDFMPPTRFPPPPPHMHRPYKNLLPPTHRQGNRGSGTNGNRSFSDKEPRRIHADEDV